MKLFTGMTTFLDRFFRTFIGIEFKDDIIIITYLKNNLSGVNLLSSSTFPLRDDNETIAKINSFITKYGRDTGNVFVSIPEKWLIIKFVEVPSTREKGEKALPQMMRFEIERHIPYQIEDVFYDFQAVEKNETTYTVVLVAVHKEKIEYVKGFLEKISLQPQIITLSPFAILNSIEFSETPVGGWQELLGVKRKPNILGRKGELCISLFLDKNDAHFALLKGGSCVQLKSSALDLNRPLDALIDDISSELSDLILRVPSEKINKLILSGHITSSPDLASALGKKLGTNVHTINPISKFFESKKDREMQELIPSVGVCYSGLGIGTLRINLLPHKRDGEIKGFGSLTTKISIPLILCLIISIFVGEAINDKRLLMKMEKKLKENEPEIKIIEKLSADLAAFKQQRNFLLGIKENDILLDVLAELTSIMPIDAWLANFDYKEIHEEKEGTSKREMIISGYALSSSALISILENSPFFEKVEFVGPITKRENKEGFKIKAVIIKPAKSPKVPSPQIKKEEKADARGAKESR